MALPVSKDVQLVNWTSSYDRLEQDRGGQSIRRPDPGKSRVIQPTTAALKEPAPKAAFGTKFPFERIAERIFCDTPRFIRITDLKTAITVRIDPDLLKEVRHRAKRENRTLTNYIETALKERVDIRMKTRTGKGTSSPSVSSEKGRL